MLKHLKRSLYAAIVLTPLLQFSVALGAQATGRAEPAATQQGGHHVRTGHKPGAVVHRGKVHSVAAATAVLLGDTAVEWQYDSLAAGEAEAFRSRADASGLAGAVNVYVDARTSASALIVGLYSSASDDPGTLLSTGSTTTRPGAWTSVSIAPVALVQGRSYWLAILGRGGTLRYRDRDHGPCSSETSAGRHLRALPSSWTTGVTYSDCPVSAYVTPVALASLAASPSLVSPLNDAATLLQEAADALPPAPVVIAPPTVSGEPTAGQALTASEGSWSGSPTAYTYQWQDCNSSGGGCSDIVGATSSSYKLLASDVGYTVRVVVTASSPGGSASANSEATGVVVSSAPTNTSLPAVSGVAQEGQTLSASKGSWSGSPTAYAYQWQECNGSGGGCSDIGGATSSSYKLVASDVGHTVRVVVTASNAGGSAKASSEATPPVANAKAPANTSLPSVSGSPEEGQTLAASNGTWKGSPTAYAYQWEDCNDSGEACSEIGGATSPDYGLVASDVGHTVRVVVTATNSAGSTKASSKPTATIVAAGSAGQQIYVSQAGAGDQSGEGSCSDAHPLSWLNSESNWGSGANRVAPGTTVDLCGTLTEQVATKGSGSNGKPVTIDFTAGAKIAMGGSGCPGSGCIDIDSGSEYVTIDGGTDGAIENTERSYAREKEEGPPTIGVLANGCRHCSIEHLQIGPLYVAEKGDVVGNTEIRGVTIDSEGGTPEHDTITNNYFHDLGWAVIVANGEKSGHIYVEDNTFYHLTHGLAIGGGNGAGSSIGQETFAHNRFYGNSNWEDGAADTNHVDGVHCFASPTNLAHYTGLFIYDNYITTEGQNTTGPIFIEGENGHTPCADKTSNIWIFNNVLTGNTCCGLAGAFAGEDHTYDNTMIGEGPTTERGSIETCETWNSDTKEGRALVVGNRTFKNNVVTSCHNLMGAESYLAASDGMEHNLWANAGSDNEAFACERGEVETGSEDKEAFYASGLSSWATCMGQPETESRYVSTAKLELSGQAQAPLGEPESGSEAVAHGKNLSSLCAQTPEEALCKNINGEPRPTSGPWNIGAY